MAGVGWGGVGRRVGMCGQQVPGACGKEEMDLSIGSLPTQGSPPRILLHAQRPQDGAVSSVEAPCSLDSSRFSPSPQASASPAGPLGIERPTQACVWGHLGPPSGESRVLSLSQGIQGTLACPPCRPGSV